MNLRLLSTIVLGFSISGAACAQNQEQDATPAPAGGQNSSAGNGAGNGGSGNGQRGGRGGRGGGMMGNGVEGTVTAVAADHYTIKTYMGEIYTVNYSVNTRFLKQPPGGMGQGRGQGAGRGRGQGQGGGGGQGGYQGRGQGGGGMNRMEQIKSADIKVGDAVTAAGQIDATAKSVGAVAVVQMDPERAKEMAQLAANYGKTWLMGKVTAINETKVTIMGAVDNAAHTFMADENTVFRKQRDPVTLADIEVGDTVRVDGASGAAGFTATTVNVMPAQGNGPAMRRNAPPPQ